MPVAAATVDTSQIVALTAGTSAGGVAFFILACCAFIYRRKIIAACACLRGRRDGASSGSGFARRDDGFDDPAKIDPSPHRWNDYHDDVAPAHARAFVSPHVPGAHPPTDSPGPRAWRRADSNLRAESSRLLPWTCPSCTYYNDAVDERCGACDGPRPARSVALPHGAPVSLGASPSFATIPAFVSEPAPAPTPAFASSFAPVPASFAPPREVAEERARLEGLEADAQRLGDTEAEERAWLERLEADMRRLRDSAAAPSLGSSSSQGSLASLDRAAPSASVGLAAAPAPASFESPPRKVAEEHARLEGLEADAQRLGDTEAEERAWLEGLEADMRRLRDAVAVGAASEEEDDDEDPFGEASSEDAGVLGNYLRRARRGSGPG